MLSRHLRSSAPGDGDRVIDKLYRFVIDTYPTPGGVPFVDLDPDVWESIGESWAPGWMPDRRVMEKWLSLGGDQFSYLQYQLEDLTAEEPWLRHLALTGALRPGFTPGWAGTVSRAARDLGCAGHVEEAAIGEWARSD